MRAGSNCRRAVALQPFASQTRGGKGETTYWVVGKPSSQAHAIPGGVPHSQQNLAVLIANWTPHSRPEACRGTRGIWGGRGGEGGRGRGKGGLNADFNQRPETPATLGPTAPFAPPGDVSMFAMEACSTMTRETERDDNAKQRNKKITEDGY